MADAGAAVQQAHTHTSSPVTTKRFSRLPLPAMSTHTSPPRALSTRTSSDQDKCQNMRDSLLCPASSPRHTRESSQEAEEHKMLSSGQQQSKTAEGAYITSPPRLKRDIRALDPPRKFIRPKATPAALSLSSSRSLLRSSSSQASPPRLDAHSRDSSRCAATPHAPSTMAIYDTHRSLSPGSPTTMHSLQADFSDLRICFAELSVTVAKQHERIRFLEDMLRQLSDRQTLDNVSEEAVALDTA